MVKSLLRALPVTEFLKGCRAPEHTLYTEDSAQSVCPCLVVSPSFSRPSYGFQVELSQISGSLMEVQLDCKYLKDVKQAKERYLSNYCSYFDNEEEKLCFMLWKICGSFY